MTLRPGYNSGSLTTNGVDIALSYTFDDVYGGTLGLRADATLNLSYKLSAFEIGGVEIAPEYEGIGTRNSNIGGNGQLIPRWRGGFSVNYNHGRHNLNLATRYMGPIIDDRNLSTFAPGILALNANPGDAAGTSIPCASTLMVPANAGTGNNGGAFVNGAPVLQPSPTGATTAAGSPFGNGGQIFGLLMAVGMIGVGRRCTDAHRDESSHRCRDVENALQGIRIERHAAGDVIGSVFQRQHETADHNAAGC